MSKFKSKLAGLRARLDRTVQQVAVGGFLVGCSAASFAADGDFDVADSLTKIAAGVAAGLLVSAAMTGAIIAMRASKLPRKGA